MKTLLGLNGHYMYKVHVCDICTMVVTSQGNNILMSSIFSFNK